MDKNALIDQVNSVLADEFEIEVSEISSEKNIKTTLNLDSLSLVDLVALIEEQFNVKIKGSEMSSIQTFGNLYDYLAERING